MGSRGYDYYNIRILSDFVSGYQSSFPHQPDLLVILAPIIIGPILCSAASRLTLHSSQSPWMRS
jgi:hypothetical protein